MDKEVKRIYDAEINRQSQTIELIASENIVSQAVLEAQGSVLTNKYAEDTLVKDIIMVVSMLMLRKI